MSKRRDQRRRRRARELLARRERHGRHRERERCCRARLVSEPYYLPELGMTRPCQDRDTTGERERLPLVIRVRGRYE